MNIRVSFRTERGTRYCFQCPVDESWPTSQRKEAVASISVYLDDLLEEIAAENTA